METVRNPRDVAKWVNAYKNKQQTKESPPWVFGNQQENPFYITEKSPERYIQVSGVSGVDCASGESKTVITTLGGGGGIGSGFVRICRNGDEPTAT